MNKNGNTFAGLTLAAALAIIAASIATLIFLPMIYSLDAALALGVSGGYVAARVHSAIEGWRL